MRLRVAWCEDATRPKWQTEMKLRGEICHIRLNFPRLSHRFSRFSPPLISLLSDLKLLTENDSDDAKMIHTLVLPRNI
jgi:hypothetical protein